MPTDRRRVSAYVDTDLADLLDATAAALGTSTSKLLLQVIEASRPVYEVLLDAATAIREAPDRQRAALTDLADAMAPIIQSAEARRIEIAEAARDPRPSNTGVRTT